MKGKLDLEWNDDNVVPEVVKPDLGFLFQQMSDLTLKEVDAKKGELILDVGCGKAIDAAKLSQSGASLIGIEPSHVMLAGAKEHSSEIDTKVALIQGMGESLPFGSCSFDKVMCKGALDHFLSPSKTIEEISRVLKPRGVMIIALANFESLGFRVSKRLHQVGAIFSRKVDNKRKPWELPPDHTYKFDYPSITNLVKGHFEIKEIKGISLFYAFPRWGKFLSLLPQPISYGILSILDRLARHLPSLADVIVVSCVPLSKH
jgi:ubiquinone/menaquinone biosynthesis C-methylase UbiE